MYTLTLTAQLHDTKTANKPQETSISVAGSGLDDIRMIMSNQGPASAFTNAIERIMAQAELRQSQQPETPAPAQESPNGAGKKSTPKKAKKAKNPATGPVGADVGAVPVVDSTAPVATPTP